MKVLHQSVNATMLQSKTLQMLKELVFFFVFVLEKMLENVKTMQP